MNAQVGIVIAAAGTSTRLGRDKIFLTLGGKPLIAWSVDIFQNHHDVYQIVLVLNKANQNKGLKLAHKRSWSKVTDFCIGGIRRQDSVRAGLNRLKDCKWVVIHDAARPFLTPKLLEEGLIAAQETGSAVAAVPVKDTIKYGDNNNMVVSTPERSALWSIQTPQIFHFDIIFEAYNRMTGEVTDDAAMVEQLGYKVKLFPGSYQNIKITTVTDLAFARTIARGLHK